MNTKLISNFQVFSLLIFFYFFTGTIEVFAQPANDNVCGAVTLTINTTTCSYYSATTVGATETAGIPAPGCANFLGGDVWFKVTVPASGHLVFNTQSGGVTDAGMAIYSGASCSGPFTLITCDDDGGTGLMPYIDQANLTPGTTLWIRVWEYGNNTTGTFGICVMNPPAPTTGDCLGAIPVCTNFYNPSGSPAGIGAYNDCPDGRTSPQGCGTYEKNSTWYSFTVETAGTFTFTVNSSIDYDWALYDITYNSCWDILDGTTLPLRCNWTQYTGNTGLSTSATYANENSTGANFCSAITCTAGQKFVLLVDNYDGGVTNYSLTFNPAGSGGNAGIYDNTGPSLGSVDPPTCGNTTLSFSFSEDISCASVAIGDLQLTGPGGPYTLSNLQGLQCNTGALNGRDFVMNVSPPLTTSGNFTLSMIGTIVDKCANPTNTSVTLPFTITNVTTAASVTQNVNCFGGNNGAATVTPSGGTTPYTYLWDNSQTTPTATNLTGGTHSVTVNDINGCSAQATVNVSSPPALDPGTIAASQSICTGTIPQTINSTTAASGGSGAISYQWQYTTDPACTSGWVDISGANGATFTPASLTQTTCYRRKATDNCAASYIKYTPSVTITVNELPVIVSAVSTNVSVCGGSNGTILIIATGTGLTYSIDGGVNYVSNAGGFSNLPQGAYPVVVQNSSGCTVTGPSLTINAAMAPPPPTAGSNATYCQGQPITNLWVTAGNSGTLNWYSDAGLTMNIGSGPSHTPSNTIGSTSYYATETTNSCESTPTQVIVTINPIPDVIATPPTQTICNGASTSIDITSSVPTTTFTWSLAQAGVSGATLPTNSIYQVLTCTGNTQGTVTYTAIPSANGCIGTPVNIPVFVNPNPTVQFNPTAQTICSGDTTNIAISSPVNGASFAWTIVQNNVTGGSNGIGNIIAQALSSTSTVQGTATYSVVATASLCVGAPLDVIVTVNPTPDVTANPIAPFICSNTSPGIALSSTIPGVSFNWTVVETNVTGASASNGSTISQIISCTGNVDGTAVYTITPTIFSCNGNPLDVTVTVHPIASVIANPSSQTICTYDSTNISLSSNVSAATFSWTVSASANIIGANNGNGSSIIQTLYNLGSVAETVTYSVIADFAGCVGLPLDILVTVNPFPLVNAVPIKDTICSNTNTNFALTSNVTGTNFNWTVSTSPNISGASSSSGLNISQTLINASTLIDSLVYTVIASANTCTGDTATLTVYVNPQPVIDSVKTTNTTCGGSDGTITIVASGVAPFEYSIDGGTTFIQNGGLFTGLGNSGNTIAIKDDNGCVTVGDSLVNITELNAPPAPLAGTNASYCSGDPMIAITATPSSGGTLTWYSNPGLSVVLATGTSFMPLNTIGTTNYYVTEKTGICESPSSMVTIIIKSLPTLSTTPLIPTICSGGNTNISLNSVPAGGTFDWTVIQNNVTGATAGSGGSISQILNTLNTSSGTAVYSVATHANGCIDTADITVFVNPLPVVLLSIVSEVCQNISSINLGGGSPPGGTYSGAGISGNSFIPSVAGLGQHFITYTYTDNNTSCTNSAIDTITVNPLPTVTLAPFSPVCSQGASFLLTGGNPPGGLYFGSGVTAGIFYPDSAGIGQHTITYSYTGAGACSNTATNTLTVSPMPDVSITYSQPISCHGLTDGTATATTINGTQPYTYLWSNGQNSSTAAGFGPNTFYFVTVTDANGCKDHDSISFIDPIQLTLTENHTNPTCGIPNGIVHIIPAGGTQPYIYQWSNGNNLDSATNLAAGVYTVTVYDSHNCFTSTLVSLTTYPSVAADLVIINPSCYGFTNGSVMAMITGGTGPFTYLWYKDGISTGVTSALNNNLPADTFGLVITDSHGCSYADSIILIEPQPLTLTLITTDATCFGYNNGEISTLVNGGTTPYTFHWSTTLPGNALLAGIYTVTVVDGKSCTISATDTVKQPITAIHATTVATHVNCFGDSTGTATVSPTGGTSPYTYIWNTNPIQTENHAINLKTGLYRVSVIDAYHCLFIDTIRINQPTQLKLTYDSLSVSCEDPEAHDGELTLHASGGQPFLDVYKYKYYVSSNPEQYDSVAVNLYKGVYDIRIEDQFCFRIFKIEVHNIAGPCLDIPTVFTPNADGIHDNWAIKNIRFFPKATIEIYNRWGNLIYSKPANDDKWDGKFNGVDVASGTYIYIIDLKNNTKPREGTITIIR